MAEEYRISVGIDAAPAAEGASVFSASVAKLTKSAEDGTEKIGLLEDGLVKIGKAADGTPILSFSQTIEKSGATARYVSEDFYRLGEAVTKTKEVYRDMSETVETTTATASAALRQYMADLDVSDRLIREAITGIAELGKLDIATSLTAAADQLREFAAHMFEVREEASALEDTFSSLSAVGDTSLAGLIDSQVELMQTMLETRVEYEAGKLSAEDYSAELQRFSQSATSAATQLFEYRNEVVEAIKEGKGNTDELIKTVQVLDTLIANYAQAKNAVSDYTEALAKATEREAARASSGGPGGPNRPDEPQITGQGLGDLAGGLGGTLAQLAGTGFGVAGLKSALGAAAAYEAQMVKVQNVLTLTDAEASAMSEELKGLAEQFSNANIEEVSASMNVAARGFRDAADNIEVLTAANKLADATFSDLGVTARVLPQVLSAFSMSADQAEDAAATLSVATGGNAEQMNMMAMMASRLGPQLQQAGVGLEEFSAVSAVLSERMGGGSRGLMRAMSGVSGLVERLTNVTPDMIMKFKEYGVELSASRVASEGFVSVLKDMMEKTGGNKAAMQDMLGTSNLTTVAMGLLSDEGAHYNDIMDKMSDKARIFAEQQARVNETFAKLTKDFRAGIHNRMEELGTTIKDLLIPVLKSLVEHMDAFFAVLKSTTLIVASISVLALLQKALVALQMSFAATSVAFKAMSTAMQGEAIAASTVIKASMGTLGAAIVGAIAGWEVGKAIRVKLLEMIPEFDIILEVVISMFDEMGTKIERYLVASGNYTREFFKRLPQIIRDGWEEGMRGVDAVVAKSTQAYDEHLAAIDEVQASLLGDFSTAGLEEVEVTAKRVKVAVKDLANGIYELSENMIQQARQMANADPLIGLEKQKQTLVTLMGEMKKATNLPAGLLGEFTAAATRKLTELNRSLEGAAVAAHQLALERGPMEQMWNSLIAGVDPAKAALFTLQDEIRRLDYLLAHDKISHKAYSEAVLMVAVAYGEAEKQGSKYAQAVRAILREIDPVGAIQEDLNNKLDHAKKLLGESSAAYQEYARQMTAAAEQAKKLAALQQDGLVQLAAKYDPLIANELARKKALIEMEGLLNQAKLTEQERAEWALKASEVINKQYDQQAREIRGNITLADAWKKAWESAIERIDGAFADLWKSAFTSMKDFTDQLKDTVKQVLAEIAHAKITRPLIMKAGQFLTGMAGPGNIFGELGQKVMDRMAGAFAETATETNWRKVISQATEEGVANGMAAVCGGMNQGAGGALYDFIGGLEGFGDDFKKAIDTTLDDLSSQVMGKIYEQAGGLYPGGENGAVVGMGGIAGGGGGGFGYQQFMNVIMNSKFGKTLAGLSPTLTAFSTAFKGGLTTWMSGGGYSSLSQLSLGAQSGVAGWGSMAGQAVGGAAFGMASGAATNAILGARGNSTRNGVFSAAGGIVGSLWGVPGALIGGAIGSLVDNIVGGGEKIKNYGYEVAVKGGEVIGDFYTKIKKYGSWFSSSTKVKREELDWWDPVLRSFQSAFKSTRDILLEFQKELGGSVDAIRNYNSETIRISTKGKGEERVAAEMEQAVIDMTGRQIQAYLGAADRTDVAALFRAFEEGGARNWSTIFRLFNDVKMAMSEPAAVATNTNDILPARFREILNTFLISGKDLIELNPALSKAGDAFRNSMHYTKEFIEAFQQLATLTVALNAVPSAKGLELYQKSNATLTETYQELAQRAVDVSKTFDGTLESITAVTEAFVVQRTAAIELAAALHAASEDISLMFRNTADSIRESLMSPDELYNYRKSKAEELAQQMRDTTDPGELMRLSNEINGLINTLYSGLDETQRAGMAAGFIAFLDDVSVLAQTQIQAGLSDLDANARNINEQVLIAMGSAATVQAEASGTFSESVGTFSGAVQQFAGAVASLVSGSGGTPATPMATSPASWAAILRYLHSREVNA